MLKELVFLLAALTKVSCGFQFNPALLRSANTIKRRPPITRGTSDGFESNISEFTGDKTLFNLNKQDGAVEFGASADLVTKLEANPRASEVIAYWLKDVNRVAASLWRKDLIRKVEKDIYRLQVMQLQFVTIQLAPSVDLRMWTEKQSTTPVFKLESVDFDPNVQILPGVGLSAEQLGIKIKVAGNLGVSEDGTGLEGSIGFITTGILPPPLRILPTRILEGAADAINREIVKFAIESFQAGATREYILYREEVKRQYEQRKRL